VFFVALHWLSFVDSTQILVVLTTVTLVASAIKDHRIALFPLIAGACIISSGLLTVLYNDPLYIILNETIYNGGFAIVLAVGLFWLKKPLLKVLFGTLFHLTNKGWVILTKRWMYMFLLLALSNEIVRHLVTLDAWVIYKMYATVVTIIFALYQFTLSRKERAPDANEWGMSVE
jgi:intracellular septation protein